MSASVHARRVGLLVAVALGGCGGDGAADGGAPDAGPVDASERDAGVDAGAALDAGPALLRGDDTREPCADRDALRRPLFGDLHVHTALSFDAVAFDVRARPADAYRFARGEPIGLPPLDATGAPTRTLALSRPLDFAVVTDHAEFFAETTLCNEPGTEAYDSATCLSYREADAAGGSYGELTSSLVLDPPRPTRLCRGDPATCAAAADAGWREVVEAAEAAYDRTSTCAFTTFVGYEWTGTTGGDNLHRNVLFRGATVPADPASFVDEPTPEGLWSWMDRVCNEDPDCAALAIPHNANLAGGAMFVAERADGTAYDADDARRRARLEPLVEIYQHKGASECVVGLSHPLASEDEACAFEAVPRGARCAGRPDDPEDCVGACGAGGGPGFIGGCVAPGDYLRGALRRGLLERRRTGVDPFRLGVVASTDTHLAAAGAVDEASYPGHAGAAEDEPAERLALTGPRRRGFAGSGGGLAGVWAEENSREAIFDALARRETFGTSGPRLVVRFFGGRGIAPDLCASTELVAEAYAAGVPMGGEVPTGDGAPTFVVSALRDPDGAGLAVLQIVKGWVDGDATRERVFDVGGALDPSETVDTATCEPVPGADALCAVWTDPSFDPSQGAFYYARVLQVPTCRHSAHACRELDVDCAVVAEGDPLAACCLPASEHVVRERAWTSPIWYTPP